MVLACVVRVNALPRRRGWISDTLRGSGVWGTVRRAAGRSRPASKSGTAPARLLGFHSGKEFRHLVDAIFALQSLLGARHSYRTPLVRRAPRGRLFMHFGSRPECIPTGSRLGSWLPLRFRSPTPTGTRPPCILAIGTGVFSSSRASSIRRGVLLLDAALSGFS